ncbi:MAG: helix-turn-helix domain-containing protein [Verrucomicrobiota bacterium]
MTERKLPQPSHFTVNSHFDDFDAFSAAAVGWDLDFRQLDRGRFNARLLHLVTPQIIIAQCSFNRKIEQRGAPPAGFRTFAIPADDTLDLRWRNKSVNSNNLLLFPRGEQLDSVSEPDFHVFALSISESTLAENARRQGLTSIEELFPNNDVIQSPRKRNLSLRSLATRLTRAVKDKPELIEHAPFQRDLEEHLVDCLLENIQASDPHRMARPLAKTRNRALKKALEVINDRAGDPVSVRDLERLCGTSGRTLRYAFEESFGLSPKQYLQTFRLNGVRRELSELAADSTKITDIANEWGFWHMGQFAHDYRRLFHELPSETLAR